MEELFPFILFSVSEIFVNGYLISVANEIFIILSKLMVKKEGNKMMPKIVIFLILNTCVTKLN
jgi:hypothetical protein